MVVVNEGRGVVMEEPSGDQGVSRGQNANKSILGSTLGQLRLPSPCNSQAAQIGEIQLVGLKGRDDGVDLFSDVFQLGQTSLVLDVGTNPLVDLSLAGLRWCIVFQSMSANNAGMERISGNGGGRSGLLWIRR